MRPGGDVLRDLYETQGLSCSEISRRYGVVRQTVANWLAAEGIPQRVQKVLNPGVETVRRLYVDEQKSLNAIAAIYGTSASVVSRWLKSAGVESRDVREATMLSGKYGVQNEAHRESLRQNIAKARTNLTAESREKARQKMVGREPPNKGKPWTPEHRAKQAEIRSSPEHREKLAAAHRGEKSHLWKGGKTPESSLHGWRWRALRREVYERDGWTCQDCGERCLNTKDSRSKPKLKIQAHHKIPRRYGGTDDLENLVTLCMSCHHKRERAYVHESE